LLRDGFLRRSFGLAGRDRVCARFSWDRIATDTLRVYDRVLGAGHRDAQLPAG
jgi:glycosyltransferase involved in cell wall biosynthesis